MSQELVLSKEAESNITKRELDAARVHAMAGKSTLSQTTAEQFYSLFLHGHTIDQMIADNPGYELGLIARARIEGNWDYRKSLYQQQLEGGTRERVKQVALESVEYLTDKITAIHKKYGKKIKRYIQTGKDKDLEGVDLFDNIATYKNLIDSLLKVLGQNNGGVQAPASTVTVNVMTPEVQLAGPKPTSIREAEDILVEALKKKQSI